MYDQLSKVQYNESNLTKGAIMLTGTAIINGTDIKLISRKICGLYTLERNIILLSRCGINKIYLNLTEEEMIFYRKKIKKHVKKADIEIIESDDGSSEASAFIMPSSIFIQQHYFNNPEKYFTKDGSNYLAMENDEIFQLKTPGDIKKAGKMLSSYIIENTGGFIAQKINKRISIPISTQMAKTRIHPNYLTVFNMFIGLLSSYFIYLCTIPAYSSEQVYMFMVLGGFLFQAASVLDGVDGEVAKFTLKVSKLGGWLDTLSDNSTLLLFLISTSYLFYTIMGGVISFISIFILFCGLAIMLAIMVNYLSKYSDSGSLVAYDREFLQTLPEDDKLVQLALNMKYITKKEMFSIFFFLMGLTGYIHLIIPVAAFVVLGGSIILTIIHFRHIEEFAGRR